MVNLDDLPVLTKPAEEFLNPRQRLDFKSEREACLEWLLTFGKEPDKAVGYAKGTVKPRCYRMDRFYRFVWEELEGGYTANVTHSHADTWMKHLAKRDVRNRIFIRFLLQSTIEDVRCVLLFSFGPDSRWRE